jgi:hypothetical protein
MEGREDLSSEMSLRFSPRDQSQDRIASLQIIHAIDVIIVELMEC